MSLIEGEDCAVATTVTGLRALGPDMIGDVAAFNAKFELPLATVPQGLTQDDYRFRDKFMHEELQEWESASVKLEFELGQKDLNQPMIAQHLEDKLDALVDLVYVAIGTALMEFPEHTVREAWRRVQDANMGKVRAKSFKDSKRGHGWDVIKPQGWQAPDHLDLVMSNKYSRQI